MLHSRLRLQVRLGQLGLLLVQGRLDILLLGWVVILLLMAGVWLANIHLGELFLDLVWLTFLVLVRG